MRVVLADADPEAKIPNLALMQLATYHRGRGDELALYKPVRAGVLPQIPPADRVYVSCVFTWDALTARAIGDAYLPSGADVRMGGSGLDWGTLGEWSVLPPEVDACSPDYDLYADDRAIGFCQRGCIRGCDFCLVKRKEGAMSKYPFHHPEDWVPDNLSKVLLLDNEFAAQPPARQRDVILWFAETGRRYSITQGYDARILAPPKPNGPDDHGVELAGVLAAHKPHPYAFRPEPRIQIAWDYLGIEPSVRLAVERLVAAGFKRREICCYMVTGNPVAHPDKKPCGYRTGSWCDLCHAEATHRFEVLARELGVFPFAMRFNQRKDDPWLNAFCRYVDRPGNWRTHSFGDYLAQRPNVRTPTGRYEVTPDGARKL